MARLIMLRERRAEKWSDDPREIPVYSIADVARSLRMSANTLADWTQPRENIGAKKETFRPLIISPSLRADGRLSFYNILEAHVLLAALRFHKIPILAIRRALEVVRDEMPAKHPLAEYNFKTKGKHIFVEKVFSDGEKGTADASFNYQRVFTEVLDQYLDRIRRDQSGVPFRLLPIQPGTNGETQPVMMDIRFASGELVVTDTGISAGVLWGRLKAGHSIERLSRDYRLSPEKIKGAIDYLTAAA